MQTRPLSVEEMCRRLRPLFGKKVDELYMAHVLSSDRETREEMERVINALYRKHLTDSLLNEQVLLEPPAAGKVDGAYPLGMVTYSGKNVGVFGLREQDWMRHVCVTGMSGSGKTTFAFQILGNFIRQEKPFLVFDWKKSFRPLALLDDRIRIHTVGSSVANFRLNINRPPKGVEPREWINLLADVTTEVFSASFGVHKLLVQTLEKAYTDFGVFNGSENYPTWHQIRDRLEEKAESMTRKSRESEWLESALRIAYSMTYGAFGETVCHKGEDDGNIEDLFKRQTIMELSSLSNTEKKFFTQFLLSYIYKYAKAGNVNVTKDFKFAILVDEAHNIFLKEKPNFTTESVTDIIFREIREYGVSLITLDQHLSKLSDVVAGNSATNVAFQQVLPADVDSVAKLMQLFDRKDFFTKLPVGTAIVKLAERHHDPFLVMAPDVKLKDREVSEQDIRVRMQSFKKDTKRKDAFLKSCKEEEIARRVSKLKYVFGTAGLSTTPEFLEDQAKLQESQEASRAAQRAQDRYESLRKQGPAGIGIKNHLQQQLLDAMRKRLLNGESLDELKRWYLRSGENRSDVMHVVNYIEGKGIAARAAKGHAGRASGEITLTPEEQQFLQIASTNPTLSISKLYEVAGLSPRKGNDLRQALEEKGAIAVREERTEKGWTKHLTIHHDLITLNNNHNHTQDAT
jgi:hypothetical protein